MEKTGHVLLTKFTHMLPQHRISFLYITASANPGDKEALPLDCTLFCLLKDSLQHE